MVVLRPVTSNAAALLEWTKDELLIQLAGHLSGRARHEWSESDKTYYNKGVEALCARLDPASKAMAGQDSE